MQRLRQGFRLFFRPFRCQILVKLVYTLLRLFIGLHGRKMVCTDAGRWQRDVAFSISDIPYLVQVLIHFLESVRTWVRSYKKRFKWLCYNSTIDDIMFPTKRQDKYKCLSERFVRKVKGEEVQHREGRPPKRRTLREGDEKIQTQRITRPCA